MPKLKAIGLECISSTRTNITTNNWFTSLKLFEKKDIPREFLEENIDYAGQAGLFFVKMEIYPRLNVRTCL